MATICFPAFGFLVGQWHKWYAWKPVRTYDGRFVWLQTIWRCGVRRHHYLDGGPDTWFVYGHTPRMETPNQRCCIDK